MPWPYKQRSPAEQIKPGLWKGNVGPMVRLQAILFSAATLVLALALFLAPFLSALTHGPGQLTMEADHATWHAEQGEHWEATDHDHHSAADHDHTPNVILPTLAAIEHHPLTEAWPPQTSQLSGIIRDGPRRPPRGI